MLKVKKFCIMIDYFSGNNWPPASNFDFFASRLFFTLFCYIPYLEGNAAEPFWPFLSVSISDSMFFSSFDKTCTKIYWTESATAVESVYYIVYVSLTACDIKLFRGHLIPVWRDWVVLHMCHTESSHFSFIYLLM